MKKTRFTDSVSFDAFWKEYPKKEGKTVALKAWGKIENIESILPAIMAGLSKWKESKQWEDRRYVPLPATWLHQRRWEDELEPADLAEVIDFARQIAKLTQKERAVLVELTTGTGPVVRSRRE